MSEDEVAGRSTPGPIDAPVLEVTGVSKAFVDGPKPIRALQGVSFTIAPGEFVCLLGPSGSGKSTLLRIAGGLIHPDQGAIEFDGRPLSEPQLEIGFVFQSSNLMPWRTVVQNVLLPIEVQTGRIGDDDARRAMELLRVIGLDGFESVYPKHLSGGMAQRVVLARALIQETKMLLMDEPFGALDALTRERMNLELLRVHQMHAMTALMVTHSIPEAVFLADRVIVLSERPGQIIGEVLVTLPRPRTIGLTATAEYGRLAMQVRTLVGNTMEETQAVHAS